MANIVITSALGFFYWIIVAHFYTTAEVGIGSAVIASMNILSLLSSVGLSDALIRFLPRAEKPGIMINSSLTLTGVLSLLLAVVFFVGLDLWSPALTPLRSNAAIVVFFLLLVLTATVSGIIESVFVAERRADFAMWKNSLISVFKIPLAVAFALVFREFGIANSLLVATIIAFFISLIFFVPRVNAGYKFIPLINRSILRGMASYSAGSYIVALLDSVAQQVLPIIVLNLAGSEQNAYFYVTFMIANLLFAVPWAVSCSLFAEGAHFEEDFGKRVNEAIRFSFILLVPGIIGLLLLGGWLLSFFGAAYAANGTLLLRYFRGIRSFYHDKLYLYYYTPCSEPYQGNGTPLCM